jgi:hypothetical protein
MAGAGFVAPQGAGMDAQRGGELLRGGFDPQRSTQRRSARVSLDRSPFFGAKASGRCGRCTLRRDGHIPHT